MQNKDYYDRILPRHYMTPSRFMDIMQEQTAVRDSEDIGGTVGYMLAQLPQPEYVPNQYPETLYTYDLAKLDARRKAFTVDATLDGFVAEYGVDDGTSFIALCELADQPVYGFDAFEGLADNGKWRGGIEHQDQFQNGGDIPFSVPCNGRIIKGWFDETLPDFDYGRLPARFVNIDCDNYNATVCVLDNIKSHIVTDTVIALDDYFNEYKFRGKSQFGAWHEFVKENNIKYEYLYCVAPAVIIKILS
jgi:hypothetical protein|tara:strand:- start:3526 stop:4266 length:741 start_codon:yes stop_codon:yes gene_type:complete